MKKTLILIGMIAMSWTTYAQEYKVKRSTGRLEINLGKVWVEGHNGSDIIFSSEDYHGSKDKRAEGLKAVNALGLDDNTGLGINVTENENTIVVRQLSGTKNPSIKILVPSGVIVSFRHDSHYGGAAKFKNLENAIELSAQYNNVELDTITGPMTVKSVYGHVEANFGGTIKSPVSIVSVYGYVDISIPESTKANLRMDSSYGEIFVAPELKIEVSSEGNMVRYSDRVQGKLNGGGPLSLSLSSNYGKIYLRKK